MVTLKTRPRKTIEDYLRLPDDIRAELIDGEILMTPSPVPKHQLVSAAIFRMLDPFALANKLGQVLYAPLDVHLPSDDMVQPDLIFIASRNLAIVKSKRIVGVPDLLIEILSPGNSERDLLVKRRLYERNGVQEYWIVDPESSTIEVNVLQGGRFTPGGCFQTHETLVSPQLAGFALPVAPVFA